jgi:hypothetical protein
MISVTIDLMKGGFRAQRTQIPPTKRARNKSALMRSLLSARIPASAFPSPRSMGYWKQLISEEKTGSADDVLPSLSFLKSEP